MREIVLNGVHYQIKGDIFERPIQPWKPALRVTGSRQYSDFSQAEMEEYHDFRSGLGLQSDLEGQTARNWWGEGVDVSTARSAVLGPLVNTAEYDDWEASHSYSLLNFVIPTTPDGYCYECTTAGTSGGTEPSWDDTVGNTTVDNTATWTCRAYLATVGAIDFQSATYFIQNSRILKWDGTNLDCVDNNLASPIDAIVITDDTDEYLIVSSATEAYYTTDGTTWVKHTAFGSAIDLTDFTEVDANSKLTVISTKATAVDADTDEDVYLYFDYGTGSFNDLDIDFEIYVNDSSAANSGRCGIAVANTVGSIEDFATTDISATGKETGSVNATIELVRGNAVATDSYAGSLDTSYYCTLIRTAGSDTVTLKIYSDSGRTTLVDTLLVEGYSTTTYRYFYAFVNHNAGGGGKDFDGYIQNINLNKAAGYMADYANRLYFISTGGKYIHYSATKNIDLGGGGFTLTGNFGTLYDFFEGKLLSDGSPTLYFCGTKGLYSLDTSTEIAYKQEISYPPLTYSGHVGKYWNANLWVATGYGILKVSSSMATFIGPDQDDGLPSGYQGYIYGFTIVNNWLVYCVNGGTTDKSSILKRNASMGGNIQVYTTSAINKPIACVHHSPSSQYTNGRLWWGEGTTIKYCMFPDTTSNVKQIATYQYVDDSDYYQLPIFRKLAAINKVALGVAAITKSCDDDEYIGLYYGLNGAAATTSLGDFKTSPRPTILTFGSGLGTEFYRIQLAYKLIRGSTNTNSPELESLMFYWYPVITTLSAWSLRIEATDENGSKTFTDLEAIRDTATLVAFYPSGDEDKTSYNVKLTNMPSREWWEQQGGREGVIEITLEQLFEG